MEKTEIGKASSNVKKASMLIDCVTKFGDAAAEQTAQRSGYNKDEVKLLLKLFDEESAEMSDVADGLIDKLLVECANGRAFLTGRGEIAAKSLSITREKQISLMLKGITPEELFIFESVADKICKNCEFL